MYCGLHVLHMLHLLHLLHGWLVLVLQLLVVLMGGHRL
jgi:hypothetical protein